MGADAPACAALAGGADVKAFFVRKDVKQHGLQRRVEGPPLDAGRALPDRRGRRHHGRLDRAGDRGRARRGLRRLRRRRGARPPGRRRRGDPARLGRRAVRAAGHDRRHLPRPPGARPASTGAGARGARPVDAWSSRCARSRRSPARSIQGAIGFGYALVVVPTLLLVAPAAVPVTPLAVATPMVIVQAVAERRALDRARVRAADGGPDAGDRARRLGADRVGPSFVAAAAGALLLLRGGRERVARRALDVAAARGRRGFASGVAGTVGAVGGPYMGLAYADRPGPVLRATISLAFAVGVVLSLAAVGIAGRDRARPGAARGRARAGHVPRAVGGAAAHAARSTAAAAARRARVRGRRRARSRSCARCSDAGSVDGVLAVLRLPGVLLAVRRSAASGGCRWARSGC